MLLRRSAVAGLAVADLPRTPSRTTNLSVRAEDAEAERSEPRRGAPFAESARDALDASAKLTRTAGRTLAATVAVAGRGEGRGQADSAEKAKAKGVDKNVGKNAEGLQAA